MKTLLMSALALAMVIGFVGNVSAKEKKAAGVKGVFASLTDDKKSIHVTTGGKKNPMDVTVTVDEKTVVTLDGAAAILTDLKPGQKVTITPATGTAEKIEAVSSTKKAK